MDRMYRPQKYIYDLTRKYYLLGRDRLIAGLDVRPGQSVLDIGCGTGRNLALIGQRYPRPRLFGLDAAEPMLEVAARKLERAAVRATLARGVAEELDPAALFGAAARVRPHHHLLLPVDGRRSRGGRAGRRPAPWRRAARCTSSTSATWRSSRPGSAAPWRLARPVPRPARPRSSPTLRALAEADGGTVQIVEIARRYAMLCASRAATPAEGSGRGVDPEQGDAVAGLVRDHQRAGRRSGCCSPGSPRALHCRASAVAARSSVLARGLAAAMRPAAARPCTRAPRTRGRAASIASSRIVEVWVFRPHGLQSDWRHIFSHEQKDRSFGPPRRRRQNRQAGHYLAAPQLEAPRQPDSADDIE